MKIEFDHARSPRVPAIVKGDSIAGRLSTGAPRREDARRAALRCIFGTIAFAALYGCAAPPTSDVIASTSDGPAALAAINDYRAHAGQGALRLDPALAEAALRQVVAIARAQTLSHDIAGPLRSRLEAVGIRDVVAAENVGRGAGDVARAIASWRASPDHDRNLRLAEATRGGFARADAAGGPWWVLIVAGDARQGASWRLF